ncbi:hypothetical protein GCM10010306_098600 [Streptomyces umbrinus]|nr:hypothetical protein GCM10010306_098600 [Streptomyces umbrinus]
MDYPNHGAADLRRVCGRAPGPECRAAAVDGHDAHVTVVREAGACQRKPGTGFGGRTISVPTGAAERRLALPCVMSAALVDGGSSNPASHRESLGFAPASG